MFKHTELFQFQINRKVLQQTNEKLETLLIVSNKLKYYITDQFKITIKAVSDIKKKVQDEIKIFPNPTNGKIYIDVKNDLYNMTYQIIDLSGKINMQGKLSGSLLDISDLSKGTYNIFLNVNGRQISKSIIIE